MYNLTTIEPDDETLATLIDAVDSAVTSLQNAISGPGTGDIRYSYQSLYEHLPVCRQILCISDND